jgi:hypothetical protein
MQHCKSIIPQFCLQGMTHNVGLTFSVGDTIPRFTISMSTTIRIGDTKNHT